MANETITGKIFQLKDPSNSYNRFPRTVMEAVYGLNTYLQNQFSALADIYMPIEGITESKPLQEFVYRKSPSTIKAKSLTLDRIYGKTLSWNQQIQDSTPEQNTQMYGVQFTVNSDGTITANGTNSSQSETAYFARNWYTIIQGHKYIAFGCPPGGSDSTYRIEEGGSGMFREYGEGVIYTAPNNNNIYVIFSVRPGATVSNLVFSINFVDLTLMGIADEISTPSDFFKLYPNRNYANNSGTLISNDASAIETVGFNQWDEEWELGAIDSRNGLFIDSTTEIRSKNYIPIFPNTTYYRKNPYSDNGANHLNRAAFYDSNKNYLGESDGGWIAFGDSGVFTTPAGAAYMEIYVNAASYNHDICINLSDPAKNGTYEPYRKSTMELGLDSIKVKSHNIWDGNKKDGMVLVASTGEEITNPTCFITGYIPVTAGATYYFSNSFALGSGSSGICYYDSNKQLVSGTVVGEGYAFERTVPAGVSYMRVSGTMDAISTACINVSSSFNGQYEPHGDITITGGLKSAGSVKDEIVGNKYIKRVGSVDLGTLNWNKEGFSTGIEGFTSGVVENIKTVPAANVKGNILCSSYTTATGGNVWDGATAISMWGTMSIVGVYDPAKESMTAEQFKATMDGVMLYYELATPIEYELVSPLVPTVAAGTTEERISPNSDGLSAPMVADMTYDANANNDSASAQYALTAGRLLNTHKLWGQDFDGTQDVAGALTGVTSIAMNGALSGVTTLSASGAVTLGSTLSVAGNTTIGGLATIAGGIKVTTTKKIWFGDTYYIELDSNGYLHTNAGFYSDSFITAGSTNSNA